MIYTHTHKWIMCICNAMKAIYIIVLTHILAYSHLKARAARVLQTMDGHRLPSLRSGAVPHTAFTD